VIGIVILNRKIPSNPKTGFAEQKPSNIADTAKLLSPTFSNPNLSANIPPKPFPSITQQVKTIHSTKPVFRGKLTIKPIKERIKIESSKKKLIRKSRCLLFTESFQKGAAFS
jgi:hypothetical protein